MAIHSFNLPVCDVCGQPWLPQSGPARLDPRTHAKRCGKCKSEKWDRDYVPGSDDASMKALEFSNDCAILTERFFGSDDPIATICGMPQDSNTADAILELTHAAATAVRKRCIHMLLNCPICHKGE